MVRYGKVGWVNSFPPLFHQQRKEHWQRFPLPSSIHGLSLRPQRNGFRLHQHPLATQLLEVLDYMANYDGMYGRRFPRRGQQAMELPHRGLLAPC